MVELIKKKVEVIVMVGIIEYSLVLLVSSILITGSFFMTKINLKKYVDDRVDKELNGIYSPFVNKYMYNNINDLLYHKYDIVFTTLRIVRVTTFVGILYVIFYLNPYFEGILIIRFGFYMAVTTMMFAAIATFYFTRLLIEEIYEKKFNIILIQNNYDDLIELKKDISLKLIEVEKINIDEIGKKYYSNIIEEILKS